MPQHTEDNTNEKETSQTEYYTIQKNIPIPPKYGKYHNDLLLMKQGDSMLFPTLYKSRAFIKAAQNLNIRTASRKSNKGWRVWHNGSICNEPI